MSNQNNTMDREITKISQLTDVRDRIIPFGFLRWDSIGKNVVFEKHIPAGVIRGLPPVAMSGEYKDLRNAPTLSKVAETGNFSDLADRPSIPKNYDFSFTGLYDTYDKAMPNAFIRWNNEGNQLVYEDALSVDDITDFNTALAPVAYSGDYADLENTPDLQALLDGVTVDPATIDFSNLRGIDYDANALTEGATLAWSSADQQWSTRDNPDSTSLIELTDTYIEAYGPDTLGNKYLRWNTAGDTIIYEENISAINVTGLADVATTGDLNDLINVNYNLQSILNRTVYSVLVYDKTNNMWVDESSAALGVGGPGGIPIVESLDDLLDVTINIPRTGETLIYNEDTQQWEDGRLSFDELANIPSNSTYRLTGLFDTATNPVRNGYLRWNDAGTTVLYETTIDASALTGLADVATSGSYDDLADQPVIPSLLDQLSDVTTTGKQTGDSLVWNGAAWVAGNASSALELDDISDVDVSTASSGDVLTFNGTNWIANTSIADSLTGLSDTASTSQPLGYLRWNNDGTLVNYETSIDVSNIAGLADVATSGDFYDLSNNPFNNPPTINDLDDVDTIDAEDGDQLVYDIESSSWLPQKQTATLEWEVINADTDAEANSNYLTDTAGQSVTVTLPQTPPENTVVIVGDYLGTYDKNPGFVAPSPGDFIMGVAETVENNNRNAVVTYTYIDAAVGWKITDGIGEGITRDVTNWYITNVSGEEMRSFDSWLIDTSAEVINILLPATPQVNDFVEIGDYLGTFDKFEVTVDGNGNNIMNIAQPMTINNRNAIIELTYVDAAFGWKITEGVGETGFGGLTSINEQTIYVSTSGNDTTGNGSEFSPYATLYKALELLESSVIRAGDVITIMMQSGIHEYSSIVKIDLDQGTQVEIVGIEPTDSVTSTGIQFVSGSAGNYSVGFLVDDDIFSVGDFAIVSNVEADQEEKVILEGVWEVTSVGTGNVVVSNTYGGSMPTLTNLTATITHQPTVVKFTDSSGFWVSSKSIKSFSNMALVGNNNPATYGVIAGWDSTTSFELGGGQIFAKDNFNISRFGIGVGANFSGIVSMATSYINGNGTGVQAADNASVVLVEANILNNSNNGAESTRSSSVFATDCNINGNGDSAAFASVTGSMELVNANIHLNQIHAIHVLNGGVIDAGDATISNTNGTETFRASGSGQIIIDNTSPTLDPSVTYSPAYGTMDVLNNGTAIIGKFS